MRSFAQAASPRPTARVDGTGQRRMSGRRGPASDRLGRLETLIAHVVIPQVALVRRRASGMPAHRPSIRFEAAEVETFVGFLLAPSDADATRRVEELLSEGTGIDDIAHALLAPAARQLGARWEDDTLSFAAVSTGMTRLHVLLHMMGRRFHADGPSIGRRLLIATNPGERHAFGPLMVAEHFRRAGWDSRFDPTATTASLAREAGTGMLDALGLSCAAERYLDDLRACIVAVRAATRGRPLCLLVGGAVFAGRPELAARLGADATADDAPGALAAVERLLPAMSAAH